jgi:hypothetical protein
VQSEFRGYDVTTRFPCPYLNAQVELTDEREQHMEARLTFKYDRAADILYIDKVSPYPEQQTEDGGYPIIRFLCAAARGVMTLKWLQRSQGVSAVSAVQG